MEELKKRVLEQLDAAQEALKVDGGAYFAGRVNAFLSVLKMMEEEGE